MRDLEVRTSREARSPQARLRTAAAIALTAAMVGALAAFGGIGYAASSASNAVKVVVHLVQLERPHKIGSVSAAADQYGKVVLCHRGHEIKVAEQAVPAHLAQGDTFGACPTYAGHIKVPAGRKTIDLSKNRKSVIVYAPLGNHTIRTSSSHDIVRTGVGDNKIFSGGNDKIYTGHGNNTIVDRGGHDVIFAGPGRNVIHIRNGRPDFLSCTKGGHDVVYADPANVDYVSAGCTIVYRAPFRRP
ncbi:MAG: calcium-binding protein [Gaiellaceae bacterium]